MTTYAVPAVIVSVHDGDTVYAQADLGWDISIFVRVRVFGINAPELSTPEGKTARDYLVGKLPAGSAVTITSHGWDKFGGRTDADVNVAGWDVGQGMVTAGMAKPWDGKGVKPV